ACCACGWTAVAATSAAATQRVARMVRMALIITEGERAAPLLPTGRRDGISPLPGGKRRPLMRPDGEDVEVRQAEGSGVVPRGGIEPPTLRFSVVCSTN